VKKSTRTTWCQPGREKAKRRGTELGVCLGKRKDRGSGVAGEAERKIVGSYGKERLKFGGGGGVAKVGRRGGGCLGSASLVTIGGGLEKKGKNIKKKKKKGAFDSEGKEKRESKKGKSKKGEAGERLQDELSSKRKPGGSGGRDKRKLTYIERGGKKSN